MNISFLVDTRNSNPLIIRTAFKDLSYTQYGNFIHIYTDGSQIRTASSSKAAVYNPHLEQSFWKFTDVESIVAAELFGILKAVSFANSHLKKANIVIFTELLTSLMLLKG